MTTKITYIRLPEGTGAIRGIGQNRNREFFLGMGCDNTWGGGFVSSMELVEGSSNLVRIRKDRPFIGPPDPSKGNKQEKYLSVVVSVSQYIPVEDERAEVSSGGTVATDHVNATSQPQPQQDPPPATPVAKQSNSQQRR